MASTVTIRLRMSYLPPRHPMMWWTTSDPHFGGPSQFLDTATQPSPCATGRSSSSGFSSRYRRNNSLSRFNAQCPQHFLEKHRVRLQRVDQPALGRPIHQSRLRKQVHVLLGWLESPRLIRVTLSKRLPLSHRLRVRWYNLVLALAQEIRKEPLLLPCCWRLRGLRGLLPRT